MSDRHSSDGSEDSEGVTDTAVDSGADDRHGTVRDRYAAIVEGGGGCCTSQSTDAEGVPTANGAAGEADCCGSDAGGGADAAARAIGYEDGDLGAAPDGANLGLGCGNPQAIAALEDGEDVLDLGSGGGFDCFLAARAVGPDGRVVGVDMTPEMVDTARENAADSDLDNVEFRLGEIEHLPVADESVDVVISNCVVNLSPDKARAFREAYRVLRPGGRLAVSDLVAVGDIPAAVREDPDAVAACVGGAAAPDTLEGLLAEAGFEAVSVGLEDDGADWSDTRPGNFVASATIEARKPTS
jgi:arsenite methyltransferase